MRPIELRRVALFAAMTPRELAAAAAATRSFAHAHGERLFGAGDACEGVTMAVDGFVRLFRLAPNGAEVTTGIVRTVEVPAATLLALAGRSPKLFAAITHGLSTRTDDAYAAAVADRHGELPIRILHALRRLARPSRGRGGVAVGPVCPLAIGLSHAEVARLVGADRASVTRAFRRLGEDGLIRRERGHVTGVAVAIAAPGEGARGPERTRA